MQHFANLAENKTLVLPVPAFNLINGGSHAGYKLAMHEFMILSVDASSFKEAMKMGVKVYHNLRSVIDKKYSQDAMNAGDEGGLLLTFRLQVLDFRALTKEMEQAITDRLRMDHTGGNGQVLFTSHAWRKMFEIHEPLVRELILKFFSMCRFSETELGLDVADTFYF
ncbi:enolase 1 [Tanacetum coccineum]|uniref:phosphopyruvate hydratase n=1 Tax=Tanacetum coccineum TaxID=301880 RepID=A0ABQ4XB47_9ASTR